MVATTAVYLHQLYTAIRNVSFVQAVTAILVILFVKWFARGVYRVYFHPLSRFPGPKFCAFTRIPQIRAIWTGSKHKYLGHLHEVYGDVVRIAPDELSFIGPNAVRDVYGYGQKGTRGSPPPKHFGRYGLPVNNTRSLVQAPDADHTRMRRIFNPAFSDRALKMQEPLFRKYVDKLVSSLKKSVAEDAERPVDLVRRYNFTTFDIMGDLTFGESLHMLDNSEYDPWVSIIFQMIKIAGRLQLLHFYPGLRAIVRPYRPKKGARMRDQHFRYCIDRVTKRLEKGRETEGVDLWSLVLNKKEEQGLTRDEMDSNASIFMIAGTETTATLVSGLTYLLLKNPEPMKKLVTEVRAAFPTRADMSLEAMASLPYVNACIKEALRLYPPAVTGLPRLTPADGSTICGHYVPPGSVVTASYLAIFTSPKLFKDPLSFVPERWLGDERYADDERGSLQPFSAGPRDCIGKNMAYHEMRLIITSLLYNFDLELCPESEGWLDQPAWTLWEKKPLMVKLKDVNAS